MVLLEAALAAWTAASVPEGRQRRGERGVVRFQARHMSRELLLPPQGLDLLDLPPLLLRVQRGQPLHGYRQLPSHT